MQTDGRFVEDIKHTAEVGAQLSCESNALALPARQRRHTASKLQVAQANFTKELQALADLGQNVPADQSRPAFELERLKQPAGGFNGHGGEAIDSGRPGLSRGHTAQM